MTAVETALAVIAEREPAVLAFAHLDEALARREAERVPTGPLSGLTVGVKDLFDTADQPTAYGSPIYAGHRPASDAAVVALLRSAGAVVLGKTVTTEFAWWKPGPTRNPHRATHTPGGSSSGSAAGVAAGMMDFAIGSQTAGSVIRPASFCGVFGLKPTLGLLPIAGAKPVAPSLDTVGLFARELGVIELVMAVLSGSDRTDPGEEVVFAFAPTDLWDGADDDCRGIVEHAAQLVRAERRELPECLVGITDDQAVIQEYEGARSLAWERATHPELLSPPLAARLAGGDAIELARYAAARRHTAIARHPTTIDELFGAANVLVTPAAVGEAPEDLSTTGDARFNRLWTLLGCPALTVPGAVGDSGLPIGVQLVARPFQEAVLLRAGDQLAKALG